MTNRTTSLRTCLILLITAAASSSLAEDTIPRCQVLPLPEHQVSFRIDGVEKLRWHYGSEYPRPFFFPFNGPSGSPLTRMGHPGAQNHDHHRSVWFAHNKVQDLDFWSDLHGTQIRQKMWYAYRDGDAEAIMSSVTGWYDEHDSEVMTQDIVATLIPMPQDEHALELQITMRPAADVPQVQLGQTNFGFLAVRVAKSISAHFGAGKISNSEGQQDEANIFGQPARWMDYSGPVAAGRGKTRKTIVEGITFFDHPSNPRYPTRWHVREDGWMGASFCMQEGLMISADEPLELRYLLHSHAGAYDSQKAEAVHRQFAARQGFDVTKSTRKHRQFEVARRAERSTGD